MATDRRFRFGAQLSFARSHEDWAAKARRVEELGYSTLCLPDHFDDQLAPIPALSAAAAATTTLRVGTLVLDNDYRHPLLVAKEAATLDLLSGGRLELGMGAGWLCRDYEQSGIAWDPPGVRIDRLEEGLAVVKGLLAGGTFSFAGRHYTVTGHPGTPAPVQQPRPPILVGGGGRRILSLAGREADIVSVNFDLRSGSIGPHLGATATAAATAQKVAWVREAAGDRFDGVELSYTAYLTMVTDDREAVAAGLGAGFGLDADQVLAMPNFAIGTVTQIADELTRRRDELGFSYVVVGGECHEAMAPVVARLAGRSFLGMELTDLSIDTSGRHLVNLTPQVEGFCRPLGDGLLSVFVPHATAGVALMETGSGSEADLEELLGRLLPRDDRYRHRHGAKGHGADHLLPILVSPSVVIPVEGGRPQLGTWQSVVLVDLNDDNPRRRVRLSFLAG